MTLNNINIANVSVRQISSTVDAAFCKTNTSYNPTNTLPGGVGTLSTSVLDPGFGLAVTAFGTQSGTRSGRVESTTAAISIHDYDSGKNYRLTNLIGVPIPSDAGDSGGCLCSYRTQSNIIDTCGIHIGRSDDGKWAVFCKASVVNSSLSVARY